MAVRSIFRCALIMVLIPLLLSVSLNSSVGGIALGATRLIYPAGAKQIPLFVANVDEQTATFIQSWVEDAEGNKTSSFVVTPPLFAIQPKKENTLRVVHIGPPLPQDYESLFWMNIKTIPSVPQLAKKNNSLQLVIVSRIKLFYRPTELPITSDDAPQLLRFQRQRGKLVITNPTPYYLTLVNLNVGRQRLPNTMIAPNGNEKVVVPKNDSGAVTFQIVNDYGVTTKVIKGVMEERS